MIQAGLIRKDFLGEESVCVLKGMTAVWVWWEKAGPLPVTIICLWKRVGKT